MSRALPFHGICRTCANSFARPEGRPTLLSNQSLLRLPSRRLYEQRFSPLTPPTPESLGKARPTREYKRTRKWVRRLLWTSAIIGGVYVFDKQFFYSSITRSYRTFKLGVVVGLDYKINFRPNPPFANSLEEVHGRNAQRVFDLLSTNGGLYLKIGQAIAMQSAILPPAFQKMFSKMFDDAPQNDWSDVQKVIREDFGKSAEEVFGVSFTGEEGNGIMERTARASASVAQVHWARLADGREVAIKIQKREIARQVGWDLWAFKIMARVYTWWFDIPMYSLVPYITERLMLETDFENEAKNSEDMRRLVSKEPRLRDRVYIPKVYREFTSRRVMTAEWIEGVRLWDKEGIEKPWKGGWREGSPGSGGRLLPPPSQEAMEAVVKSDPNHERFKPSRDEWKGKDKKGGLGLSYKDIMTTMVDLFSAQMFLWGVVHCDPHPGNIFIRRLPNGRSELVLIDHGLYIQMKPEFRHQYALLWKSLLTFDNNTIREVVSQWGIANPDMFASATLLRPYTGGSQEMATNVRNMSAPTESEEEKRRRAYEMQQKMRQGIREVLADEKKWPRELIFIGRNIRIVQGNNQFLGSPVNRIKITGTWASRALAESPDLSFGERMKNWGRHLVFRTVLLSSDFFFWYSKVKQFFGYGQGMEDDIENQMRSMMKGYGVEMQHGVFEG